MQYFIFIALILCSFVFPRNRFLEISLLVMIFLVFAFNGGSADYDSYKAIYYSESQLSFLSGDKTIEIGYQIVCRLFRSLNFNFENYWVTITGISVLVFYSFIKRYTKNVSLVLSLFAVFPMLISAVQFRQWLAGVIVLFGLRYLESSSKSDAIKYILVCLLASTIHVSSIFYLSFLLPILLSLRKAVKIAIVWIVIGGLFTRPILQFVSKYNGRVLRIVGSNLSTSLTMQIFMLLLLFGLCLIMRCINKQVLLAVDGKKLSAYDERCVWIINFSVWCSVVSLFLWPFLLITNETFRLMRIIIIIEYVSLSIYAFIRMKRKKSRVMRTALIIAMVAVSMICLYIFCIDGQYFNTIFHPLLNENRVFKVFNFTY